MEFGKNYPLIYLKKFDYSTMRMYYFEIGNELKLLEFDIQYHLLKNLIKLQSSSIKHIFNGISYKKHEVSWGTTKSISIVMKFLL